MKWLLAVYCLAAYPAVAVYQPTESELQLIQDNREGLEKNLKNALPLQSKAEICIGYLKNIIQINNKAGRQSYEIFTLQYWGKVKYYVDTSVKYSNDRYPRLYYYDQKLYKKFGSFPKGNQRVSEIIDAAVYKNYLDAKDYVNINQQYAESLRSKDLNKVCMVSVTDKMRGELFPATASMDKLFYPGITSDNSGKKANDYRAQYGKHLQFTQLLEKIEASYY